MDAPRVERRRLGEVSGAAVDTRAQMARGGEGRDLLAEGALAAAHDRCEHGHQRAGRTREQPLGDLLDVLRAHRSATARAVRTSQGGEEHAQVVVDLAHGPHRGARVADARALLDGDGRRQPAHRLHVGAFQRLEELPGVGREALDVAPATLGVESVEGEAALAGTRGARHHHQAVAGQVAVDAPEVVDPRPTDGDRFVLGRLHRPLEQVRHSSRSRAVATHIARRVRFC
jgi:hypothetical protein